MRVDARPGRERLQLLIRGLQQKLLSLNGVLHSFFDSARGARKDGVGRLEQPGGLEVTTPLGPALPLAEGARFIFERQAQPEAVRQRLTTRLRTEIRGLRGVRIDLDQLAHPFPVAHRRRDVVGARPLCGAAVPARCDQPLIRLFPVMGEQSGLLVELVDVRRLDRARDGLVDAAPPLAQLRVERDLLRERVLEGVLRYGVERLLVDELRGLEGSQCVVELALREIGHRRQNGMLKLLADHGGRLQHLLLALGQAGRCVPRAAAGRGWEPGGARSE